MYRLSTINQRRMLETSTAEASQAIALAAQLLGDSTAGLVFDAENHRYWLGNRELRSVSSIVESYAPFDTMAVAKRCSKNPRHELYGLPPEKIASIWKQKGEEAAENGTKLHAFGEACYMIKKGTPEEMDAAFWDRYDTTTGLEARDIKEEAVARWWETLDLDRYVLVAAETRIANPQYQYAGTFDLLLYDLAEHYYVQKDYKTNKDLFRWYGGHLRAPLSIIKDDDHGKYTLQQNLYRLELENLNLHVGRMDLIWIKEDGSLEEIPIEDYQQLIRYAMAEEVRNNRNLFNQF